ncbi:MAG: RidA family protein [Acidobacteria bacterium]|nr:RidA family protein [Acidobacteriota bacterium]
MQYHHTDEAPKAIGPYSQAVSRGMILATSGQIPIDPTTNQMVEGSFEDKARRVFENLAAVLRSAGADFSDVIRATVYLTDLADFEVLNRVFEEYFGHHKPSRSTVGVAQLPKGSPVEVDLLAVVGDRRS